MLFVMVLVVPATEGWLAVGEIDRDSAKLVSSDVTDCGWIPREGVDDGATVRFQGRGQGTASMG